MAYNPNFKAVLLTNEQIAALRRVQEAEKSRSPYETAPTVHAIARGMMNKILKQEGYV